MSSPSHDTDVADLGRLPDRQPLRRAIAQTYSPVRRLQSVLSVRLHDHRRSTPMPLGAPAAAMWATVLLGASATASGCIYTGPINERPRAEIEFVVEGPVHYPGDTLTFSASKSTDAEDGRRVRCTWSAFSCETPAGAPESCAPIGDRVENACWEQFVVAVPDHKLVRVQLEVRDSHGARSLDTEAIAIGNRAPGLLAQATQGAQTGAATDSFVVTLPIQLVASAVDLDGDPADLKMEVVDRPTGASAELVPLPAEPSDGDPDTDGDAEEPTENSPTVSTAAYQLTPDLPGVWQVEVTADDGFGGGVTTERVPIVVSEDRPPCIAVTSPAFIDGSETPLVLGHTDPPRHFSALQVTDDLDPYPAPPIESDFLGTAQLSWFIASPQTTGELLPVTEGNSLVVDPTNFTVGDVVTVRLEARDRVARTSPCGPETATCSIGGTECVQRVTWEVEIR